VPLAELFRTAAFRTAALACGAFGASTLVLFAIIYWQTAVLQTERIDAFLVHESAAIARENPAAIIGDVQTRYAQDLHRQSFAAVFSPARQWLAGALRVYPADLPADGVPRPIAARLPSEPATAGGQNHTAAEQVRAVARLLPDGRVLVVGRSDLEVALLRRLVLRALAIVLLPAMVSALAIGVLASQRTLKRVAAMNATLARIMDGHLHERLAVPPGADALAAMAVSVNAMLADIERLMTEVQGVGDDIAHDLRTPLARMRARLENGLARAAPDDPLVNVAQQAIADLDQAFALITALLRIGQIEGSARRAGFALVNLAPIATELGDLYQPVAEMRGVALQVTVDDDVTVLGDRDLLFEAAANLLDNAIKFTPEFGTVSLRVYHDGAGPVLAVRDSGPGIAEAERALVLKRFYRADRSRHVAGHGLGLSLVAAIVRLHLFELTLHDAAPGLLIEIRASRAHQNPNR
jgi:signal transduction histidine kinase